MATSTPVRNIDSDLATAAVTQGNARFADLLKLKIGTIFHAGPTALVTAVVGDGTLATLQLLVADLVAKFNTHCASACSATTGIGTHLAADAVNGPVVDAHATLGACQTTLNTLYTAYNTHLSQSGVHCTNDGTNTASSSSATDQASSDTRATDIRAKFNAHAAAAMAALPILTTAC